MILPEGARSRIVEIDGLRLHYLEAGETNRPKLVLMHSCDYGSSAEFSWERNIPFLSAHFHVIAPDMLGYGLSDKHYDFGGGHMPFRIRTLRRLLQTLCIEDADFVGNSCGASILLKAAAVAGPAYRQVLPIRRMVLISPSIIGTPGPGRAVMDAYDGTREAMRALVAAMFFDEGWARDEIYLERKHREGNRPGHWEAVRAASMRMPGRAIGGPDNPPWEQCLAPVMFVNGDHDRMLAEKDGAMDRVRSINAGRFHVVPQCGHCAQTERPDIVHALLMDFLDP